MKFVIPKIRTASSVGIYLADHEIAYCALEKGILGTKQFQAGQKPSTKQDWAVELHKILEPLAKEFGPSAAVVIGLPASHAFFATLPTEGGKNEGAEALLAEHHCCTSIPPQELCADMLPVKVGGKSFAAVGASRRRDLQILTDAVRKLGFRYVRVEPAPWALLRTTTPNPSGKMGLRLLVGGNHMLATLVVGQQPLLWRPLELSEDVDATELVVSLVRSFETYASQHLGVANLDSIVMEGPNVKPIAETIGPDLGDRFSYREGLGATAEAIARGLALGGMDRDKPAPDLARPLAPPPLLWDLIPRGEVALLTAIIICLGLWLWVRGTVITNNAMRIEEENDRNLVLKASDDALMNEKKAIAAQVQSVTAFLSNRIIWTEYVTQLSHRIPDGMKFVTILGEYELKTGTERNERKAKRNLIMDLSAMVPRSVSAPRKVDELLELIRAAPVIQRDFPDLKLSTLRVSKNLDRGAAALGDPASFTITCLPKGQDVKPKPPAEKPVAKAE